MLCLWISIAGINVLQHRRHQSVHVLLGGVFVVAYTTCLKNHVTPPKMIAMQFDASTAPINSLPGFPHHKG